MLTKDDLQQIKQAVREELKDIKEDIRMVDMKVELVNKKVDVLQKDTAKGFVGVTDAIEDNYQALDPRIKKLEVHTGIPHQQ